MRRAALLGLLLLAACGDGSRGPRMDLDLGGPALDFGAMRPNEVRRRTVAFRNAGDAPLVLSGAETTCACARASIVGERREYAPGDAGSLEVVFTAPAAAGALEKRFSVRTNEPEGVRSWVVRADVALGLVLSGATLDFGRGAPGATPTASIRIRSPKGVEWTVLEVVGSVLGPDGARRSYPFAVQEVEDPAARVLELTVTHPPEATPGLHEDSLTISTSHPDQPSLPIAARLEVLAR
jgi:hypothetical protein